MATNDSIASPAGEVSPESSCYATVWEAVKSVPRARIWQNALERTGLNLVIDTPNYRGTVFLVQDDGVIACKSTEVYDTTVWPQGDCGARERDWWVLTSTVVRSLFACPDPLTRAARFARSPGISFSRWDFWWRCRTL